MAFSNRHKLEARNVSLPWESWARLGVLVFFKGGQLLFVITGHPTRGGKGNRFIHGVDTIFGFEPGHGHVKLKNTDGAKDVSIARQGAKELDSPLLGQLNQALEQLLGLERAFQLNPAEMIRGKAGNFR